MAFCIVALCTTVSTAQQPAHFILGESQFRGTQIYDAIQDKNLDYWFATDEGLYFYNHYSYQKIECDKAKSNAIFNFEMGSDGVIYCHNLNSQVFRIKDKKCDLFYELQDDEKASYINLCVTEENHLLIAGRKLRLLDKNGKVIQTMETGRSFEEKYKLKNNDILLHLSGSDSLLVYSKGKFSIHTLYYVKGKPEKYNSLYFFSVAGKHYGIDRRSKELYLFDPERHELLLQSDDTTSYKAGNLRIYETSKGLWMAGSLPGVVYLPNGPGSKKREFFFSDYFISHVYEDAEGNILLSTFDKGIIVVPDIHIPDVIGDFKDDLVTSMYPDQDHGLYLGTSKGAVLKYDGKHISTISNNGIRSIDGIYSSSYSNLLIYDDGMIRMCNKKTGRTIFTTVGALKDAIVVSDSVSYIGTNYGVQKLQLKGTNAEALYPEGMQNRVYFLEYDRKGKYLYASTSNGLMVADSSGRSSRITYDNKDIYPNHLAYQDGSVFAATKKHGILILSGGKVVNTIRPLVNGRMVELKKMVVNEEGITASTADGLYLFSMDGKMLLPIHTLFRFSNKKVLDFAFFDGGLWVSHSGGLQRTDLQYRSPVQVHPFARIDKVLVNDKPKDISKPGDFKSSERKLQFTLSCPTLRDRENIRYQYRLLGYEKGWSSNSYLSNVITYNALAPGDYTLEVRIDNQGTYSAVTTYKFSIAQPLYARWYIIIGAAILFILVVGLIYRRQLRIQQEKSRQINELNASKLTAIQSQMNPHFIFNSLNSIQDLILKGDVEHSYSYITTFSNLVRRTLNYSDKEFIEFEQEIKLLELYLSLEQLRFKRDLAYTIDTNNITDILIPPMLIQPFIENALVHGLHHKEGPKRLKITFELKDALICVIEDNGIGRAKSKAIRERQHKDHESFAGAAIRRRFEILSRVLEKSFNYQYEDIREDGADAGTRVILTIPVQHKY